MMIRPVETAAPIAPNVPANPKARAVEGGLKGLLPGAKSAGIEKSRSDDQFLQELLMGAEGAKSPLVEPRQPLVPAHEGPNEDANGLEPETKNLTRPNVLPQKPLEALRAPDVFTSKAAVGSLLADAKHAALAQQSFTSASQPGSVAAPKVPSAIAAPPQNEELRQILAEAFPEEVTQKFQAESVEEAAPRAKVAKHEVRDSEQFIALQSLPSQLKLKPLQGGERQKATYAQAGLKSPQAPTTSAHGGMNAEAVQDVALPQFKKIKSSENNVSAPDARIDLSQLEQVLGRGAASELVLHQPDQQPARVMPQVQVEGHVTTGSMARERLSSESILGLRGAVNELSRQGGGEIQIRLKPEALGEIKLQVATRGSQVGIRIHAENPQAARVIEQSLDSLRDRLGEQNLKLGHIEFSSHPSSGSLPIVMADPNVVETNPTWTQPVIPNTMSTDNGFASNLGNGRNSQLEQDRDEAVAPRGVMANRGLRNQASQHAGRLNVLA